MRNWLPCQEAMDLGLKIWELRKAGYNRLHIIEQLEIPLKVVDDRLREFESRIGMEAGRAMEHYRAGIEARLSTLKHRFGMRRAFYKGEIGFERHVGWCIIAHNLVAMSRAGLQSTKPRCRSG